MYYGLVSLTVELLAILYNVHKKKLKMYLSFFPNF
jgi:hypothetical protein